MVEDDDKMATLYDSPMKSPGFSFWQTFLSWQRRIDTVLAPYNLTQPSFSILAVSAWLAKQNYKITKSYAVRQKVIVEMSQINKMHVSQLLRRLADRGLITISPFEHDRREHIVELTPEGWEVLKQTIEIVEKADREQLANVKIG